MSDALDHPDGASDRPLPPPTNHADPFSRLVNRPKARQKVMLAYDPNDAVEIEELAQVAKMLRFESLMDPHDTDKADRSDAAKAAVERMTEATDRIDFYFVACDRHIYEELLSQHPATDKQTEEYRRRTGEPKAMLLYDSVEFPAHLMVYSLDRVEFHDGSGTPTITDISYEQAKRLHSTLSEGDWATIADGVSKVNMRRSRVAEVGKD